MTDTQQRFLTLQDNARLQMYVLRVIVQRKCVTAPYLSPLPREDLTVWLAYKC